MEALGLSQFIIRKEEPEKVPDDVKELYLKVKELESKLTLLRTREENVKEELRLLQTEMQYAREEAETLRAPPLAICQFGEMVDNDHAISLSLVIDQTNQTCHFPNREMTRLT